MKKLTYSFAARVASAFLFAFTVMGGCLSAACVIASYAFGFYSVTSESFYVALRLISEEGRYQEIPYEHYTNLFEGIYHFRYMVVALFVIAVILAIVLFIFQMCSAGRKEGQAEPYLGFFNRIPLDIYLAVCAAAEFFVVWFVFEELFNAILPSTVENLIIWVLLLSVAITAALLVLLSFCSTFAARVKAGKWWRNSVIFFVLRLIWKGITIVCRWIADLFHAVSVAYRTALISAAALFIIGFLAAWAFLGYEPMGMLLFLAFAFLFFCVLVLCAWQFQKLVDAGKRISEGDFEYKTDTSRMFFDFKRHGENLNSIGDGMAAAVDQKMRSERLKTELITNVSHDIKTPLTNIVNYVDLLKKAETEEERDKYIEVLSRQAARLKKLTVDLVEASKASTGNIGVERTAVNTTELINQSLAEYAEKLSAGNLEPVLILSEEPVSVMADGRHLWRVLDNLLNNVIKYAQPGTRVYIGVTEQDGKAEIAVKNISKYRLNISADELMERFVRGDTSRHTEGSGLGLSIARSLTELMGGEFDIAVDGDLFKAVIRLDIA